MKKSWTITTNLFQLVINTSVNYLLANIVSFSSLPQANTFKEGLIYLTEIFWLYFTKPAPNIFYSFDRLRFWLCQNIWSIKSTCSLSLKSYTTVRDTTCVASAMLENIGFKNMNALWWQFRAMLKPNQEKTLAMLHSRGRLTY